MGKAPNPTLPPPTREKLDGVADRAAPNHAERPRLFGSRGPLEREVDLVERRAVQDPFRQVNWKALVS